MILKASVADATEREEKLLSGIEQTQNNITHENTKIKGENDQLTCALQEAETDKETLEKSLTQALEISYAKYKALRLEKENIEKDGWMHMKDSDE